jgi:hypothetical protein
MVLAQLARVARHLQQQNEQHGLIIGQGWSTQHSSALLGMVETKTHVLIEDEHWIQLSELGIHTSTWLIGSAFSAPWRGGLPDCCGNFCIRVC